MSKILGIEIGRKQAAPELLPPWRADFRRKDELPDLKVIRTHFLLNYGAAALALGLVAYAGWCEFQYAELRGEIAQLTKSVDAGRVADGGVLARSGVYSEYAKTGAEFARFKGVPIDCQRVLAEIGSIRNEGMTIRTVSVDAAFFDATKKKEIVRIAVVGTQRFDNGDGAFIAVKESYRKFRELKLWSTVKGLKPVSSPSPGKVQPNLLDHTVEFTFELSLTEDGK